MWKQTNQAQFTKQHKPGLLEIVFAAVILVAPMSAVSGLIPTAKKVGAVEISQADTIAKTGTSGSTAGYGIRCWQYGRLILDENYLEAPPDTTSYALSLKGADKNHTLIHLFDTKNAVCVIKGVNADLIKPGNK